MFGPAQAAVAKAVADSVAAGVIPQGAGRKPGDRLRRVHSPGAPKTTRRSTSTTTRPPRWRSPMPWPASRPPTKCSPERKTPRSIRSRVSNRARFETPFGIVQPTVFRGAFACAKPRKMGISRCPKRQNSAAIDSRRASQRLRCGGGGRCGRRSSAAISSRRTDPGARPCPRRHVYARSSDLQSTAIFIGGSDVSGGRSSVAKVTAVLFRADARFP